MSRTAGLHNNIFSWVRRRLSLPREKGRGAGLFFRDLQDLKLVATKVAPPYWQYRIKGLRFKDDNVLGANLLITCDNLGLVIQRHLADPQSAKNILGFIAQHQEHGQRLMSFPQLKGPVILERVVSIVLRAGLYEIRVGWRTKKLNGTSLGWNQAFNGKLIACPLTRAQLLRLLEYHPDF